MAEKTLLQELKDHYGYDSEDNTFPNKKTFVLNENLLNQIQNAVQGTVIYVKEYDVSFEYSGTKWVQCGEDSLLREGLIKESIYVNDVQAG